MVQCTHKSIELLPENVAVMPDLRVMPSVALENLTNPSLALLNHAIFLLERPPRE
jgi:hypothetical protein